MGTERVADRGGSRETGGHVGRKSCVIRLFVKLVGQFTGPPGPRALPLSQWAPRELFSPRLARRDYY